MSKEIKRDALMHTEKNKNGKGSIKKIDNVCCYVVETETGVGIFTTYYMRDYMKEATESIKLKAFNSFRDANEYLDECYGPDIWSTSDYDCKTINKIYDMDSIGEYYYYAADHEIMITRDFRMIEELIEDCKMNGVNFIVEVNICYEEAQEYADQYIMNYYGCLEGQLPFTIPTETIVDIDSFDELYDEFL